MRRETRRNEKHITSSLQLASERATDPSIACAYAGPPGIVRSYSTSRLEVSGLRSVVERADCEPRE